MTGERCQRVGVGEARQLAPIERRAMREIGDTVERLRAPCVDDPLPAGFGEPRDHPQTEP